MFCVKAIAIQWQTANTLRRQLAVGANTLAARRLSYDQRSQRQQQWQRPRERSTAGAPDVFEMPAARDLEAHVQQLRANGQSPADPLRRLLFAYCRHSVLWPQRDDDRALNARIGARVKQIVAEMAADQCPINDAMNATLMGFYTNCEDMDEALRAKARLSPQFPLDAFKVFNLAALLAKADRTDAAIALAKEYTRGAAGDDSGGGAGRDRRRLLEYGQNATERDRMMTYTNQSINRLCNALIDKEVDPKAIKRLFVECVEASGVKVTKTGAGPLMRMHMIRDQTGDALEEFLFCAASYQVLPWSMELMRALIKQDNTSSLEVVVNKTMDLYGRDNALLDLSAAYIYCGQYSEARRQMESAAEGGYRTGGQLKQSSVEFVCDKFLRDKEFNKLKQFIRLTASLPVDRDKLYRLLIVGYLRDGQSESARDVLNEMRDQLVAPTDHTLRLLKN